MAAVNEAPSRANIRIEIKNDFNEEMEVDNTEEIVASDVEIEDGEISDSKSNSEIRDSQTRTLQTNRNLALNRDENVFAEDDQEKLKTRAERFGLNPADLKNMTCEELQDLYDSLGISEEDEIHVRFEAIHMHGTKELNTQDVFEYFGKYGPNLIEWIDDESCNVVWLDKISTARAFCGLSRAVEGMPASGKCDGEIKDEVGRSILLKNREVLLSDDGKIQNKVHIDEINIAIPPGFWRLGDSHPKAKYLLLRFAKRSDKKPLKAEKFSEYYRKYGNPQGLISESKKKKMKGLIPEEKVSSGNPWGNLARNWNNDILEREPIPEVPFVPKTVSKSILNRLGANKRQKPPEKSPEPEPKKSKVPRMRMYADEEEARLQKVKQLKKIRELEKIEQNMTQTPDLRNRIGRHMPQLPETAKIQPIRVEVRRKSEERVSSEEDAPQQKSKVTVIVKKPTSRPTVASTIWSRLDLEKRQEKPSSDSDSSSESSDSDSESEEEYNSATKHKFSKAINARPGFNRDLKSRLGLSTDHKSPLRIEINNDHYKKS